jgi:hypothetical protein
MFKFTILPVLIFSLFFAYPALAKEESMAESTFEVLQSNLGTSSIHGTTRGHQRKVVYMDGAWIVAFSNEEHGSHMRLSRDGANWTEPLTFHTSIFSSSYTFVPWKEQLFLFYTNHDHGGDRKGDGVLVQKLLVKNNAIELKGEPQTALLDPEGIDFYISAAVGNDGTLWLQSRHNTSDKEAGGDTRLTHTTKPGDIAKWTEPVVPIPVPGKGSIVPLIVPLPDGKAYSFARTYQAIWGKLDPNPKANQLLGNLFDGTNWSKEPSVLSPRMTHIMGDDRRMSAVFDDKTSILHLVCIDAESVLRYRQLHPPYGEENWQPSLSQPGGEVYPGPVHCAVASLDAHVTPSRVYVVFGHELEVDKDPRGRTGELRLAIFDGSTWRIEERPVSEPGSKDNWYPNLVAEVNPEGQLGVLYLKGKSYPKSEARFALLKVRPTKGQ